MRAAVPLSSSVALGLALCLAAPLAASGEGRGWGRAPDGEAGFGEVPDLSRVERLFHKAQGDDGAFLASLTRLTSETRLEVAGVRLAWERRGYLALLPRGESDLELVYVRWKVLAGGRFDVPWDEERARTFARFAADARAWTRRGLLAAVEDELRELNAGLSLFHGHAHGRVSLQPGFEFELMAQRTDLAAARVRALRFDLSILREDPFAPPGYGPVVEDLTRLLVRGDAAARDLLRVVLEDRGKLVARISADLRTTRLERLAAPELTARARGKARAARALHEVRAWSPTTPQGRAPSPTIAAAKQSERYRRVLTAGLEGLAGDPFEPLLNFFVGEGYQYLEGESYADAYYDRFLCLEGIRYYDYESFRDRHLTAAVQRALLLVGDWRPGEPPGGEPTKE